MVKQGDIILLNLNQEDEDIQENYRLALVISTNVFNKRTELAILCPISDKEKQYSLRVRLDKNTNTQGYVLCEQVKSFDVETRGYKVVEQAPKHILEEVVNIVFAEIKAS